MKRIVINTCVAILALVICPQALFSQKITNTDLKKLRAKEDTLAEYSMYLNTDSLPEDRMIADSVFTKTLVRALQIKNSFCSIGVG